MAAKKKSNDMTISKTQFVKNLPSTMPAKEVVEKAKAAGVKLSVAYVYSIRSHSKTGSTAPRKRGRPFGSVNKSASRGGAESELYRLIERIVEEKVNQVLTARFGALLT